MKLMVIRSLLLLNILLYLPYCHTITEDSLVTDLVFLDLDIGGVAAGVIVIGLFGATTPKTVQNFISLATHEVRAMYGKEIFAIVYIIILQYNYGYKGAIFHRLIPNFMMQGNGPGYSLASHRFASKETSVETPIKFEAIHWNVSVPIRSFKSRGIVQECNCTAMNLID